MEDIILVDTNVIIEAVRTGCWNGLLGHYSFATVEECVREARSGIPGTRGYVRVSDADLDQRLTVAGITDHDRILLSTRYPGAGVLDSGERDLWAYALSRGDEWRAVCADKAAVRVAIELGWGDRLVSLEEIALAAGIRLRRSLKRHYTRIELSRWRTQFLLDP